MAIDAVLTLTQKNDIFDMIRRHGPPANEFGWDEEDHRWTLFNEGTRTHRVSVLRHLPTGYYCLFGDWVMVTCPGVSKKVEPMAHEDQWGKRWEICADWLERVAKEAQAPDLFLQFMNTSDIHFNNATQIAEKLGNYIHRQMSRLQSAVSGDPELAIGTAKEFLETVCKTILLERGVTIAKDEDLPTLVKTTIRNVKVIPDGVTAPHLDKTIVTLLNNLGSITQQLAEIRNACGTGHGKTADHVGLATQHAQLAVGAAITLAVFLFRCHEAT